MCVKFLPLDLVVICCLDLIASSKKIQHPIHCVCVCVYVQKSGGDSAEQIVQMFDELQDSRLVSGVTHNHSSQPSQHAAHSTATQTRQRRSVTKSREFVFYIARVFCNLSFSSPGPFSDYSVRFSQTQCCTFCDKAQGGDI